MPLFTAAFCMLPAVSEAELLYRWSFDKAPIKKYWIPFAAGKGKNIYNTAKIIDGAVYPARPLAKAPALVSSRIAPLRHKSAALILRLKAGAPSKRQMALFTYAEQSWGQARFGIYITPDSRVRVDFFLPKERPAVKYTAFSPRQTFRPGASYTLQAVLDKGRLLLYLNGKNILDRKDAPSFASFTVPVAKYHPALTFGCTMERNKPEQHYSGGITSVEYHNSVPEVPESSGNTCHLTFKKVSKAPVLDGFLNDEVYKQVPWSTPFIVLGQEKSSIAGVWENADDKFVRNAAVATAFCDEKYVYAAFRARFPADTPPDKSDSVEFFLQTGTQKTWQVIADTRGKSWHFFYASENSSNSPWLNHNVKTAVKVHKDHYAVEMAIPLASLGIKRFPAAGTAWKGNFARFGKSCGGLSTWAPVGQKFFTPAFFGLFLHSSRKEYISSEIRKIPVRFPKLPAVAEKANELLKEIAPQKELSTAGFDRYIRATEKLQRMAVKLNNAGKTMLIWHRSPWGDFGPDLTPPVTSEIKQLSLTAPQGARAIGSFMVSNLTERPNMFTLKVGGPVQLISRLRFREGGFVQSGKRMFPDAIFELPLGEVVRQAAEYTSLIWVDIDTKGLKPGVYKGRITLVPAYSGFKKRSLDLSLRVSKVDLSKVSIPVWTYPLRTPRNIELLKEYDFNTSCLLPRHFAPDPNKKKQYDFSAVDLEAAAFEKNGIPRKEIRFIAYLQLPQWSKIRLPDGKTVTFGQPGWKEEYGRRLRLFRDHVKQKFGMDYSSYAFYITDEPHGDPADPKSSAWHAFKGAEFIKSVDPKFRTFTNPCRFGTRFDKKYVETFDILVPCVHRIMPHKDAIKLYSRAKAEVWSYSINQKISPPSSYRRAAWFNMYHGFRGTPVFYDLFDAAGDQFISDDGIPGNPKWTSDYAAVYRNSTFKNLGYRYPEKIKFAVSRRMESWYLGMIDFKLSEYCRNRIAARKAKGENTAPFEKEFAAIAALGFAPDGNMEQASARLLKLAEKL